MEQLRLRLIAAREVTVLALLAAGLGLLTALVASLRDWPVAARVVVVAVLAAGGVVVVFMLVILQILSVNMTSRFRRLDDLRTGHGYQIFGLGALAGAQGFGVAVGVGWPPAWQGLVGACLAVWGWGLAGVGLVPLPGRARRMSHRPWVRMRVRYRRRARHVTIAAVVWWPGHLPCRADVSVTGTECEHPERVPRVEWSRDLRPSKTTPVPPWARERIRQRVALDEFAGCRVVAVVVTTIPEPTQEGRASVRLS